jgi:hypothetical protein
VPITARKVTYPLAKHARHPVADITRYTVGLKRNHPDFLNGSNLTGETQPSKVTANQTQTTVLTVQTSHSQETVPASDITSSSNVAIASETQTQVSTEVYTTPHLPDQGATFKEDITEDTNEASKPDLYQQLYACDY